MNNRIKIACFFVPICLIIFTLSSCIPALKFPKAKYDFFLKLGHSIINYQGKKLGVLDIVGPIGVDLSNHLTEDLTQKIQNEHHVNPMRSVDLLFEYNLVPVQLNVSQEDKLKYLNENTDLDILISTQLEVFNDELQQFDLVSNRFDENSVRVTIAVFDVRNQILLKEVSCRGKSRENTNNDVGDFQISKTKKGLIKGCLKRITKKFIL